MAQINTGAVDSSEISHHDDDPRAFPFPFGEFAGTRLDTVSGNLRRWATQAHLARHPWYPAYLKANQRYEELLLQTPEAYPFPFGEHEDKRLDEVPEDLIWWSVHPLRSGRVWHRNLAEANRLYLDKVYDQKSPGSVTIWFGGMYEGYTLDDVYTRPGFIKFWLKPEYNKCSWYYKFEDLVQRYKNHLQTHRQPYHPTAPAYVENPTGQRLGRCDDGRGSVEPDDDYERDGQENGSDSKPANNTNNPAVNDDSGGHDDIPLDELRNKTITKRLFEGRVTSLDNCQRICHSSSGEETDTADELLLKRLRRRSEHEVQRSAQTDSHSDGESAALDEPETHALHLLTQSFSALSLSQESARSPINDELPRAPRKSGRRESGNDGADIPEYNTHMNTPSRLGRSNRVLVQ